MIPKQNRLKNSVSIRRIRSDGKRYTCSIAVLIETKSTESLTKVAFIASRSVGGAVQRNRSKRVLRSRVAPMLKEINGNHDLVVIARKPLLTLGTAEIDHCLKMLFVKAELIGE